MFTIFYGAGIAFGQAADSLKDLLRSGRLSPGEQSIVCAELALYYQRINLDSVRYFGNMGLEKAQKANSREGLVKNCIELGDRALQSDSLDMTIDYFLKASAQFDDYPDPDDKITVWLLLGNTYYVRPDYVSAIDAYLKGLAVSEEASDTLFMARFNNNLGAIEANLLEHESALDRYQKARFFFHAVGYESQLGYVLNNIGIIYFESGQLDSANAYYSQAMVYLERTEDLYGQTNVLNNIGDIWIAKDSIGYAFDYYFQALALTDRMIAENEQRMGSYNVINTYGKIGLLLKREGNYKEALAYLRKAYTQLPPYTILEVAVPVTEDLAEVFYKLGQPDSAIFYYKMLVDYSDSLAQIKNDRVIAKRLFESELEQQKKVMNLEIVLMEEKKKKNKFIYLNVIVGMVTVLTALIFLVVLQRTRMKRNELKRKIERNELEVKKKELATNVMYLMRKNNFLEHISSALKESIPGASDENRRVLTSLVNEIERNYSKDSWKEFETRFQEVQTEFYKKLVKKYPTLTPNEQRLCAFLSLNLSSKEISMITFQSLESIRKARYRLRKKLQVSSDQNMVSFLRQLV